MTPKDRDRAAATRHRSEQVLLAFQRDTGWFDGQVAADNRIIFRFAPPKVDLIRRALTYYFDHHPVGDQDNGGAA